MHKRVLKLTYTTSVILFALTATPATVAAESIHHVHVTSSNATEAVRWYARHLPCEPLVDRTDGVDCGGTEVIFDARPSRGTSQRTGIDHLSFSFTNVTEKMAELESVGVGGAGVRLQRFEGGDTVRETETFSKQAFIFDPWGTRIELVEDAQQLGFHHVHLSATDPKATLEWYADRFGGEAGAYDDVLEGVKFDDLWLLVDLHTEGVPASTAGRSIDHIAFQADEIDERLDRLRSDGIEILEELIVPEGARTSARRAFVGGPNNVRLAVVEPGFAGVDVVTFVAAADTGGESYAVVRTPWGDPDFQGVWTGDAAHGIPLERPADAVATEELTPEEALARRERGTLGSIWGYESEWRDTTLGYTRAGVSQQVAMVVDPPSGKLPALTTSAERRMAEAPGGRRIPAGPEENSPWGRCITRGPIPMPQVYNNGLQIVQGPGFVSVQREMVHETRLIPTDGRPHSDSRLTSYLGDAVGQWEGDTLVVEITNFNGKAPFPSERFAGLLGSGYGASKELTLTERYTRTGPETLLYEFTFDDPSTWDRPWTGRYTFVRDDSQYELVEYACHEGNYGMFNILSGARSRDRESTETGR